MASFMSVPFPAEIEVPSTGEILHFVKVGACGLRALYSGYHNSPTREVVSIDDALVREA